MDKTEELQGERKGLTWEEQAKRDSLTMLYNNQWGKDLINNYLEKKTPYASCGMVVLDIDYFKSVNDIYGHLFGDEVLVKLAAHLARLAGPEDVVMRAGGDEFVILYKGISHTKLLEKAMILVDSVHLLTFREKDYHMTVSVGVCFLPENVAGFTYNQLFGNADWALYRPKQGGRDRCVFCDDLRSYEYSPVSEKEEYQDIDVRYLRNDIISTAFEIFEKMNNFQSAMELLLKVIGIRFRLDRITVIRTDLTAKECGRQYQWTAKETPAVLETPGEFSKEDFLTLFHSYDEYGTTVLHYDHLDMYSESARALLMQGNARTVVYAAMYCEGKYVGAISYVMCDIKRIWSKEDRRQLGELTKIISVHMAKNQMMNASFRGIIALPEYDQLTGLLSFGRFREEVERMIVGGYAVSHMVVYTDFVNFKYFNQKYGYGTGDQLLKELCNYVVGLLNNRQEVYFTRVVADQFILFLPVRDMEKAKERLEKINGEFLRRQSNQYPMVHLRMRSGVYCITPDCAGASEAIDSANYARRQVRPGSGESVKFYDSELEAKQRLENDIINGMDAAMKSGEFQLYLQPRVSLEDFSITGAEALVRWKRKDGSLLYPDSFIPLYEENGRVTELDFYIFEKVAAYLAKNNHLGRRQVPISINASILHAENEDTVKQYLNILKTYGVDPELTEIELTETATVAVYENVRRLFGRLQGVHMKTALDDFGAGYSILNTVVDIPVNTVKLDRAFLRNCQKTGKGMYLLGQIIKLVQGLGCHVVCEGIETPEQVEILKKAGCKEGQGFLFSRAVTLSEFEKMMYEE